jgi:hypothetical protein
MIFAVKAPELNNRSAWFSYPKYSGKKDRLELFLSGKKLNSFDQPMGYCYERMTGIIEYLDIIQSF